MRIIGKMIAAPLFAALTVSWAMLTFLFCWASTITQIASGLVMLLAVILFVTGQTTGGIVYAIIAFLLSPLGLPLIIGWLLDKLGEISASLSGFMMR